MKRATNSFANFLCVIPNGFQKKRITNNDDSCFKRPITKPAHFRYATPKTKVDIFVFTRFIIIVDFNKGKFEFLNQRVLMYVDRESDVFDLNTKLNNNH